MRAGSSRTARDFATLDEALDVKAALEREIGGRHVRDLVTAYVQCKQESGVSERSCETARHRLMSFFEIRGETSGPLAAAISAAKITSLGESYRKRMATETQRMTFAECRRFGSWCVERGHMRRNLFAGLKHAGRVNRGKPQLTIDEARRYMAHCLRAAHAGDASAIAALVALLCGLRASEVTERIARDVDDGGRVLRITRSKTAAGVRRVLLPTILRGLVQSLCGAPQDRLWPDATRYWLHYHVQRLCREASVPVVSPHGLRGTHASLCVRLSGSSQGLSDSLGHVDEATTDAHYTSPAARADAQLAAVAATLAGTEFPNFVPAALPRLGDGFN